MDISDSTQAFDDSKMAGRIANLGLQKMGVLSAGLGDKLNENADKVVDKARALEVLYTFCRRSSAIFKPGT